MHLLLYYDKYPSNLRSKSKPNTTSIATMTASIINCLRACAGSTGISGTLDRTELGGAVVPEGVTGSLLSDETADVTRWRSCGSFDIDGLVGTDLTAGDTAGESLE